MGSNLLDITAAKRVMITNATVMAGVTSANARPYAQNAHTTATESMNRFRIIGTFRFFMVPVYLTGTVTCTQQALR